MSNAGNPQRRTTYLISLTLVKVEAVPEDDAENQKEALPEGEGSPEKKIEEEEQEEEEEEEEDEEEEEEEEEETEEVRDVPEKEEGLVCAEEVGKEIAQVEDEYSELVPVKYGTPTESRRQPEWRDIHRHKKDTAATGKSKDTYHIHAPVRQMVKVYGGTSSEGTFRREGPRSDALRPKNRALPGATHALPKGREWSRPEQPLTVQPPFLHPSAG